MLKANSGESVVERHAAGYAAGCWRGTGGVRGGVLRCDEGGFGPRGGLRVG